DPSASHPAQVLLAFAVALVIRAWLFDTLLLAFGVTEHPRVAYRLISSLPSTGAGLLMLAVAVSLARDYGRSLERIERAQRSFGNLSQGHGALIARERQRVIELARVGLDERLRDLGGEATPEALERVRTAIEDVVQPLSHSLNEGDASEIDGPEIAGPPAAWGTVLRGIFTSNPIRPLWYTAWFIPAGLLFSVGLWGPTIGIRFTGVLAVTTATVCTIGYWLWPRLFASRSWSAKAWAFSAIALSAGLLLGLSTAWISPRLAESTLGRTAILMAISFIAGWVFAALVSLQRARRIVDQQVVEAEEQLHHARVRLNAQLRAEMRALARTLHGPVQDALSVAAFRIRAALDSGDPSPRLITEVQASIRETIAQIPAAEREAAEAEEVLSQLALLWDGVTNIDWRLSRAASEALARHTATRSSFNEIVRETCSNAIRHGEAPSVSITGELIGDELELTVRNVGAPVAADARTGLGTRLLEELTLSWRREPTPEGTLLTARLPLVA
ncbi:MAG: hypothetical protein J0H64_05015, partial [Actinobacteria bacterium]|nr:hypothetical protein [Actinomycetota bacterium]